MTHATDSIRLVAEASRRRAILECTVAVALLFVTGFSAAQGHAWHAATAGVTAGILLGVAALTALRALTWRREADKREGE
jgi:hypothetical protein